MSALIGVSIDQAKLRGRVQVSNEAAFTGGTTIADTLQGWATGWGTAVVSASDLLVNDGLIRDSAQVPIDLRILGDLQNNGAIDNVRVVVAGNADQVIGAGPGIAAPEFVLESGLNGGSYQWFKDGQPLAGETAAQLTLAGVCGGLRRLPLRGGRRQLPAAEHRHRRVRGSDRRAGAAVSARLAQNHPNPFNPATEIAFSLAAAGRRG